MGNGVRVQTYLTVSVRRQDDSVVVEVSGELDLASATQLERALQLAWREQPQLVVIELGELHFIDMAGLRALLEAQRHAEGQGSQLVLAHVRAPLRRVLTLAHMSHLFTIRENHS